MKSILLKDLYRYEGKNSHHWQIRFKYIFFVPGFTYTYFFRQVQCSHNPITSFIYSTLLRITSYITHIQIPPATNIGEGLYIGHYGHIIINPSTIIGRNFSIAPGVLIGNAQGKNHGTPVIGDNVKVGQNAIVVGGAKIGNDVLIAPGAFVNFDVPDNSIVIGNPGTIIRKNESPTKKYIVYPV